MDKSLEELIREKQRILETSDDLLIAKVLRIEEFILSRILEFIFEFTTSGGRIVQDEITDFALNRKIKNFIINTIRRSKFEKDVLDYLKSFDQVDELNRLIHLDINDFDITKLNLNPRKRIAIEEVSTALTNQTAINQAIEKPIRKILYDHITLGSSIADAQDSIRNALAGRGLITKYTTQITRDALNGYDGYINSKLSEELNLNAFRIVGSLKANSRENCIEMVTGSGAFATYHKGNGIYLKSDIPNLIRISRGRKGWDPSTNESNYIQKRNGFNCRHAFIVFNYEE